MSVMLNLQHNEVVKDILHLTIAFCLKTFFEGEQLADEIAFGRELIKRWRYLL